MVLLHIFAVSMLADIAFMLAKSIPELPDSCLDDEEVSLLQISNTLPISESAGRKASGALEAASDSASSTYFWRNKNGDLARTGTAAFRTPSINQPPSWSWHETRGDRVVRAAPVIDANKNIYLASLSGYVHKMNKDGDVLWTYVASSMTPMVPVLMNGSLFGATTDGHAFALNMETGKEQWRQRIAPKIGGDTWSMTAADGIVIAAIANGTFSNNSYPNNNFLVALDAATGQSLWHFKPAHDIYNILIAVANGSLVFADSTGLAYRLKLADGKEVWRTSSPGANSFSTGGAMMGPDGVVYVTSNLGSDVQADTNKGVVTAIDFATGKQIWQKLLKYPANNAASVGRIGLNGTGDLAIILGLGTNPSMPLPWKSTDEKKNAVVALDAKTGNIRWWFELPVWYGWARGDDPIHLCLPDSFGNAAINGDGVAFLGHQSGLFYALQDKNGDGKIEDASDEVITFDAQAAFQGSPGLAPGMIVATPCDGMHVWSEA